MKKLLLSMAGCMAIAFTSTSQTTLFQDDFELGSGNWTLNSGGFGANDWIVNNVFTGSWLTNTPTQPGAITNSPTSQYLHIYNAGTACGGLGDCQAVFLASSGGDKTAEMVAPISTIGQTGVTFDFWYLCMGAVTTYGTVDYSLDGGTTWTAGSPQYQGMMQWTNQALTNPAWDNQASLKFRFHWHEGTTGNDPAYSVDQVHIYSTGGGGGSNTITTGTNLQPTSWCEGSIITTQVDFTSTGTFAAGNVYTAQLSDAAGSFASPTDLGTLVSTANSGMVVGIIPGSVPAGTGYRIRITSSNPATIGSDNGSDLVVNALPNVTLQAFVDVCEDASPVNLVGGSPAGGTYSGTGVSGGMFDPSVGGQGTTTIGYSYTDGNGCANTASESITVIPSPTVTLTPFTDVCDNDPFFTLTGGSPAGGTYTGPGVTAGVFDPTTAGAGTHTLTYSFTDGNGCTGQAFETIFVDICGAIGENGTNNFVLYPNPVSESFTLISELNVDRVDVLDMSGRVIKSFNEQASYNMSDVPSGVYFVTIHTSESTSQLKIVVQ